MGLVALFNHLLNFVAPALWLALLVPLVARLVMKNAAAAPSLSAQTAILFIVCALALVLGLCVFGRDGKMTTYGAMVVMSATAQWLMLRGWKA